jgi:hypothetical protein
LGETTFFWHITMIWHDQHDVKSVVELRGGPFSFKSLVDSFQVNIELFLLLTTSWLKIQLNTFIIHQVSLFYNVWVTSAIIKCAL